MWTDPRVVVRRHPYTAGWIAVCLTVTVFVFLIREVIL